MQLVKKIIRRFLPAHSFKKNVFKSIQNKKVLVCYIASPFFYNCKISHTNIIESRTIAKIFHNLGFQVDVIDFNVERILNISEYSFIFGFGDIFEQSFYDNTFKGKRIYYSTGAYVGFQNISEITRIKEVNKKFNVSLFPKRTIAKNWCISTSFSDHMIILGNEWTRNTFADCKHSSVFALNASAFILDSVISRIEGAVNQSFLWFGGSGLVHKGLDLCLEYFASHVNFQLHICGPMENDFFEIFKEKLSQKNIHYHNFTDVNSKKFSDIVSKCMFTIMPSCSEGQSTALLTTMGVGLIPIATKYCGITLNEIGIEIEELTVEALDTAISKSQDYSNSELNDLSIKNIKYIQKNHSIEAYSERLSQILETII